MQIQTDEMRRAMGEADGVVPRRPVGRPPRTGVVASLSMID